jgi:8-oxo-dGTP diphosphatase
VKPHHHVTAGVIQRDGRTLITRRPEGGHLAGYWEFPGGKQEGGETLEACLMREIHEELGIQVHPSEHLLTEAYEYETKRVTLHFFACAIPEDQEPRAIEGQEIRWATPEDLLLLRFPPPDLRLIALLQNPGDTS